MQHADPLTLIWNVEMILRGPDGEVKQVEQSHNITTNIGVEDAIEQLLASPAAETKPTHIAIGKGSGAAEATNTALGEETKRVALSSKTRSAKVLTLKAKFEAGEGTGEVKEAGVFCKSSAGDMYARNVFSVINKGASDTLEAVWTITGS